MRRLLTASTLFALVMLTTAATGQPPPGGDKKPADKAEKKAADPTEAAIAAALANDADVRMARAKIQLAEAELAKARQSVTLRVVMLKARMDQLKTDVRAAEAGVARIVKLAERGVVSQEEVVAVRDKLEAAKAALDVAEAEWKLLTGAAGAVGAAAGAHNKIAAYALDPFASTVAIDVASADLLARYIAAADLMHARAAVKGPIPDRIRAALDKPVKLGAKGEKVTFEKALEVFKKDAGLDVPVRGEYPKGQPVVDKDGKLVLDPRAGAPLLNRVEEVVSEGEELPVGAWFQLFEDKAVLTDRTAPPVRFRFYVREYGLLVASVALAPPDALPLTEFWKQKPPATKDAKPEAPKW